MTLFTHAARLGRIRPAGLDDVGLLARHRAEMFREMGPLDAAVYASLVQEATRYVTRALPSGEYLAWVATPAPDPATIIAGAGVQLREMLPRPDHLGTSLLVGQQALIVNVYTEPEWRRQGVAERLVQHILDWCRDRRIASTVLHASAQGRTLYEKLGFAPTNEMRLGG
jgi:GNAT superfamily N-acetyltransferase